MEFSLLKISTTLECEFNIYVNVAIISMIVFHTVSFNLSVNAICIGRNNVAVKTPPEKIKIKSLGLSVMTSFPTP